MLGVPNIRSCTTGRWIIDKLPVPDRTRALSEDSLRSGLTEGDPGMLMELYDRTSGAVYSYLLRLTSSPYRAYAVSLQAYSYVWHYPDTLADVRVPVRVRMVMLAGRLVAEGTHRIGRDGRFIAPAGGSSS